MIGLLLLWFLLSFGLVLAWGVVGHGLHSRTKNEEEVKQ